MLPESAEISLARCRSTSAWQVHFKNTTVAMLLLWLQLKSAAAAVVLGRIPGCTSGRYDVGTSALVVSNCAQHSSPA